MRLIKMIVAPIALFAVALALIASGETNEATLGDEKDGDSSGNTETFKVGDTVDLGSWSLKVHKVADPMKPTNEFLTPAQGNRWIGVDATVFNNGEAVEAVSSILCFELNDGQGRTYEMTISGENVQPPDGEVQPGGKKRGTLVYEIPNGVKKYSLHFKCDLFSSGSAIVNLT